VKRVAPSPDFPPRVTIAFCVKWFRIAMTGGTGYPGSEFAMILPSWVALTIPTAPA
jgi:hypothetical protein